MRVSLSTYHLRRWPDWLLFSLPPAEPFLPVTVYQLVNNRLSVLYLDRLGRTENKFML